MANAFSAAKLVVADLEKCARFYGAVFGLEPAARVDAELNGRNFSEIIYSKASPEAASFVLFAYHDAPTPVGGETIVVFRTDDVDKTVKLFCKHGGVLDYGPEAWPDHGVKSAFLRDIEGHVVELIEVI